MTEEDNQEPQHWTAVERQLRELWHETLGVWVDDRDASFFSVGGDSIRNVQFVAEARRAGLSITIRDVLVRRTIAGLGQLVQERSAAGEASPADDAVERLLSSSRGAGPGALDAR
ncbi:MAG: phosphopantetheine-binding protein [Actinomycetota bacterium]|nr:phosphopantetheine-binding protein [Actinomycetota bacterium]MDQ2956661.1 phosphopantetheine-binding protein [Actinomycetota bacterium]